MLKDAILLRYRETTLPSLSEHIHQPVLQLCLLLSALSSDLDRYQTHFPVKILGKPLVQTVANLVFAEIVIGEMDSFKSINVDSSSPVDTVMGPNGLFRCLMDFYKVEYNCFNSAIINSYYLKKIKFPKLRYPYLHLFHLIINAF
jgi:hypothetical protein